MREIDDYIEQVKDLPPAPRVLPQLMPLLSQTNTDCSHVVELIKYDPALTTKVLKVCNNALYAASVPISDLDEAVARLGYSQIFRIVASVTAGRALAGALKGHGIDEGELWKHSVTTAIACQLVARDIGDDENVAFTAGLLHDIGKIVLSRALEGLYIELIQAVEVNQQALLEAEKQLLGVHHAEVGGRLLERWNFPPNLVDAVNWHHQPNAAVADSRLASLVYLGNMLAYFLGHGYGHQAFAMRGRTESLQILGIQGEQLPHYMIKTLDNFEVIDVLFSIHA